MYFEEYAKFESNIYIYIHSTCESHALLYSVVSESMLIVSHLLKQNKNSIIFHDWEFCECCYICKISKSQAWVMVQWIRYLGPSLIISDLRAASRTVWWKKIINFSVCLFYFWNCILITAFFHSLSFLQTLL